MYICQKNIGLKVNNVNELINLIISYFDGRTTSMFGLRAREI